MIPRLWLFNFSSVVTFEGLSERSREKDARPIRAAAPHTPPRGFEPLSESAQLAIRQAVTESSESVLAFCLALLSAEECDLAAIVAAWPCLPESIRARILGLVEGATASAAKG